MPGRRRNVLVLGATYSLMSPLSHAINAYSALYFSELGASPAEVGLISAVFSLASGASAVLGGYLADRVGRKRVIVPLTAVFALSNLAFAYSSSVLHLLAASLVSGLSLAYSPALDAILKDSMPEESMGRESAVLFSVSEAAGLAGPALAGLLVSRLGLEGGCRLLYAALFAAAAASAGLRLLLVETVAERPAGSLRGFAEDYSRLLRRLRGDFGRLLLSVGLSWSAHGTAWTFLQLYAVGELGVSPELWGVAYSATGVVFLAVNVVWGWLADRFGPARTMSAAQLLASTATLLLGVGPRSPWTALAYMGASALYTDYPAYFSLSARLIPPGERAKASAVEEWVSSLFSSASSTAGGLLYGVEPRLAFLACAALLAAASAVSGSIEPAGEGDGL